MDLGASSSSGFGCDRFYNSTSVGRQWCFESPQDAHRSQLNIQPQCRLDALLFILLLYLLLLSDACSFVPIVTFHLSPSVNVKAS